ncbi:MAG: FecR domain-containing protein, partial [Prevotella sp.]|nr:FecR domain-containing protein [Prevotella sp.]
MTQDKNEILARVIMGKATEEEFLYLQENCSPEELAEILDANDLAMRYRLYDSINEERAYNKVKDLMNRKQQFHTRYLTIWRVAAVLLVIIVGGAYWWYRDYTKVTPPEISQEVLAAIQTSKQVGKSEASKETITTDKVTDISSKGTFSEEILQQLLERVNDEKTAVAKDDNIEEHSGDNDQSLELLTTRHDKEFWITLDDGTLVHMNANSRIIYPEKFNRDNREVILHGEAYFMVSKDKSRPFIVHTLRGDVKVYGTEFNVNTRARDNSSKKRDCTSVVLVKGSVGVTPSEGKEYMLTPGQQIIIKDHSNSP